MRTDWAHRASTRLFFFYEDGAVDTSDIFSILNAFYFDFFFLPSRVRFWFFWPDPTTSLLGPSLTCLEGRSSSRGEQGNGREITQSRLREQGNIVRKKTIRAHREATEIAPGWRYVPDNISISAGVQFEPRSTALEEEREEKKTWGLMTN